MLYKVLEKNYEETIFKSTAANNLFDAEERQEKVLKTNSAPVRCSLLT